MAQEKFDTDCILVCIKKYLLIILGAVVVLQDFSVFLGVFNFRDIYRNVVVQSQSCLTFCDPMDCSTPGFPVLHCFLEFSQTRVHWVGWCHPATSSSAASFSFCLQSFPVSGSFPVSLDALHIRWPNCWRFRIRPSSIQVWFPFGLTSLISLQSKGFSRVFCISTIQKHQFFSVQPSLWPSSHNHTWLLEKP